MTSTEQMGGTVQPIELFRTDQFYIFSNGKDSLWWDRADGSFTTKTGWDLAAAVDPECVGLCYGIIGKVQVEGIIEPRLMLIKECCKVGEISKHEIIYKIKSILLLSQTQEENLHLAPCKKHQNASRSVRKGGLFDQKAALAKTWGAMKSATNSIKTTTQQAAAMAIPQVKNKIVSKDREKFEKRLLDELNRIFTDTDSFYFSPTFDLTNTIQRQCGQSEMNPPKPLWQRVDDRFFWNKYMLQDIMKIDSSLTEPWLVPVIQGYVQIENCKLELGFDPVYNEALEPRYQHFKMLLVSRRSRHRAGTRYKRRGVDDSGNCANYVETEQIIIINEHVVSFVQVRGSVPVFWSQPGYKYRPPPRIDRGEAETQVVFENHFQQEQSIYGPICVVNLVEQSGKEKTIWDAYTNHMFTYNHPEVTYATFDFHEYCRGMHFENVSYLLASLSDTVREIGYCWRDKQGIICKQKGVFRVNCIDCLDRTNVVQTAIAKSVMEIQLTKLGLLPPEGQMPHSIRNSFQLFWANNGDIISKQYAGTNALKGDYTRTGERKFTGLMKDGMNSANRYYLSRFKDAYRQAAIDMMLGQDISDDVFSTDSKFEEDTALTAEHVKLLIEDCKKMLISEHTNVLGSWGLIDADLVTGDPTETEMDTILILTNDSYYVAEYDEQIDRVTKYQQVALKDINLIELGASGLTNHSSVFKLKNQSHYCIRISYSVDGEHGYFHMFRSTNLRFFNNMAVVIKTSEEIIESLKSICECILVALEVAQLPAVMYIHGKPFERKKSKVIMAGGSRRLGSYLDLGLTQGITRNVSETQLVALKNVGTKALTNISQHFSKINKLGQSLRKPNSQRYQKHIIELKTAQETPSFTIGTDETNPNETEKRRDSISSEEESPEMEHGKSMLSYSPEHKSQHMYIDDVGIIMCQRREGQQVKLSFITNLSVLQVVESKKVTLKGKNPLIHTKSDVSFDVNALSCSLKNYQKNLDVIKDEPDPHLSPKQLEPQKLTPPNSLQFQRKISRSSNEVEDLSQKRSNSEQDLNLNLSYSKSENTLKNLKFNFVNVISPSNTKDFVLSPFSKFTKGMQTLGANFDPRKLKTNQINTCRLSEQHLQSVDQLMERWKSRETKLIAL